MHPSDVTRHGSFHQRSVKTTRFAPHVNFHPCTRSRLRVENFQLCHVARSVLKSARVEGEFMAQRRKVLLVEDDNEDCREILAAMIRLMRYEVIGS